MKDSYVWDALWGIFRSKKEADPRFPKYTFIKEPKPKPFDPRFPRNRQL